MRVRVLFFGRFKEIVGTAEDQAEVADGARVEDVFKQYGSRHPELAGFRDSAAAAVNQQFAEWDAGLAAGDEVAFLPPVSGGEDGASEARLLAAERDRVELVRAPIATSEIAKSLKAPENGAQVVFEGIVRNHSGGRETLYLEYEAYEAMALAGMSALIAEMRARFPVDRVAMLHRLGRIEIGETAVLVVVSSAHRAAAFDACRYGIDELKRRVPIWKKEFFADGAVWAEGERC
ncbi:MAG: molybdopterin converting factor subunit 1 [Candidatus Acidiferrales bacterium]